MNARDREDSVTLQILETIEGREDVSQRHLADRLGVALGLANLYLKRCVGKGLVKIKQAPANRYLYYLTPKGFAEKSRLTAEYLSMSFDFYRRAGESCIAAFHLCVERDWKDLLFCGVSEFGEIASMRADEQGINVVGTFDPTTNRQRFVGRPVWRRLEDVPSFDACLLTALSDAPALRDHLSSAIEQDRILVPDLFGLNGNLSGRTARAGARKTAR